MLWSARSLCKLEYLAHFSAKHTFRRNVIRIYIEHGTLDLKVRPMT